MTVPESQETAAHHSDHAPSEANCPGGLAVLPFGLGIVAIIIWGLCAFASALSRAELEVSGRALPVTSSPSGSAIFVDDQYRGKTPMVVEGLRDGVHLLRIERLEHRAWIEPVRISVDTRPIEAALEPLPRGNLKITSAPVIGEVLVDGRVLAETPAELSLLAGHHRLVVRSEGYASWQKDLVLEPNQTILLEAQLQSKAMLFLCERIESEPWRVSYAYELAHHYLVSEDFDLSLEALENGLRHAIDPRTPTGEANRLMQEIGNFYKGQFKFGSEESRQQLQPRLLEMLQKVIAEQPRNTYAALELGSIKSGLKDYAGALEVYRKAYRSVHSGRARRMFAYYAASVARKKASSQLTSAHRLRKHYSMLSARNRRARRRTSATVQAEAAAKRQMQEAYAAALRSFEKCLSEFPQSDVCRDSLLQIMTIYRSYLNDPAKYIAALRRFLLQYPDSGSCPGYRKTLGDHFYTQRSYGPAILEYRQYLKDYPNQDDCPAVHVQIALCLTAMGKADAAIREYEFIASQYPRWDGTPAILARLITLHKSAGDARKSASAQKRLLKKYPYSREAEANETNARRRNLRERAQKALSALAPEKLKLAKEKSVVMALSKKATSLATLKNPDAEIVQKQADDARARLDASCEPVLARYRKIVRKYKPFASARNAQLEIIQICRNYYSDFAKLQQERKNFIALFPEDSRSPALQREVAQAWQKQGDKKAALEEYHRYRRLFPENDHGVEIQWLAANMFVSFTGLDERELYVRELERFVKEFPEDDRCPQALYSIAIVYYYQSLPGDREKGIAHFTQLEKDYPHSSRAAQSERYRDRLDNGLQPLESKDLDLK